jgi:hypothetical protein
LQANQRVGRIVQNIVLVKMQKKERAEDAEEREKELEQKMQGCAGY